MLFILRVKRLCLYEHYSQCYTLILMLFEPYVLFHIFI